jgi:hypothetical protein
VAYFKSVSCRLAIQLCIGHFPDGRESHRTFSIKNIRRDAGAEAIAALVRAIAPLLKYPITKVRLVKKDRLTLEKPASGCRVPVSVFLMSSNLSVPRGAVFVHQQGVLRRGASRACMASSRKKYGVNNSKKGSSVHGAT